MPVVAKIKAAVLGDALAKTVVRFRVSCVTNNECFDVGQAYRMPAGQAKDFIKARQAVEVVGEGSLMFALGEIEKRELLMEAT